MLDRRTHPRVSVSCPVHFSVHLLGSEFLIERFGSDGTVLDISRTGVLAEVDRLLSVGTVCALSLVQADGLVRPRTMIGRVCRSALGSAGWIIGIEFESPVDVLPSIAPSTPRAEVHTP